MDRTHGIFVPGLIGHQGYINTSFRCCGFLPSSLRLYPEVQKCRRSLGCSVPAFGPKQGETKTCPGALSQFLSTTSDGRVRLFKNFHTDAMFSFPPGNQGNDIYSINGAKFHIASKALHW
jgi:hypothetical protein